MSGNYILNIKRDANSTGFSKNGLVLSPSIRHYVPSVFVGSNLHTTLEGFPLTTLNVVPRFSSRQGYVFGGNGSNSVSYRRWEGVNTNTSPSFTFLVVFKVNSITSGGHIAGLGSSSGDPGSTLFRLIQGVDSPNGVRLQAQDSFGIVFLNTDSIGFNASDGNYHTVVVSGTFGGPNTSLTYFADGRMLNSVNPESLVVPTSTNFNELSILATRRSNVELSPADVDVALFIPVIGLKMDNEWCINYSRDPWSLFHYQQNIFTSVSNSYFDTKNYLLNITREDNLEPNNNLGDGIYSLWTARQSNLNLFNKQLSRENSFTDLMSLGYSAKGIGITSEFSSGSIYHRFHNVNTQNGQEVTMSALVFRRSAGERTVLRWSSESDDAAEIFFTSDGRVGGRCPVRPNTTVLSDNPIPIGKSVEVAYVLKSGDLRLYVDGRQQIEIATGSLTSTITRQFVQVHATSEICSQAFMLWDRPLSPPEAVQATNNYLVGLNTDVGKLTGVSSRSFSFTETTIEEVSISRPSGDITTTNWTLTPPGSGFYSVINEVVADDLNYVSSPNVNSPENYVLENNIFPSLPVGTWLVKARVRATSGNMGLVVRLIGGESGNTVVGTGSIIISAPTYTEVDIPVTITDTATRVRFQVYKGGLP
jgi:hypothetical protein